MFYNLSLILSSVALNAFAQLFIRQGMLKLGKISLNAEQIFNMVANGKNLTSIMQIKGSNNFTISI